MGARSRSNQRLSQRFDCHRIEHRTAGDELLDRVRALEANAAVVERNIREAVGFHLEVMREYGEPIPKPSSATVLVEV